MSGYAAITSSVNSVNNQTDNGNSSSGVIQAIKNAANQTGVDFSYLMQKASQESGFDPVAKAASSSASGLFQFTSQTWLSMVKKYGAQYGLGDYAAKITADAGGHLSVSDTATKHAILALRNDPTCASEMACELDKQNAASLQQNVGGKIGSTELYLAHFLGASGASDFLNTLHSDPSASGADVLPAAAASNPSVFYDANGDARSVKEIYQHFAQKFSGSSDMQFARAAKAPNRVAPTYASASNATTNAAIAAYTPVSFKGVTMASAGNTAANASTMFQAMLLSQGQDITGNSSISAFSACGLNSDRKKNAMEVLSAVG